MFSPPHNEDFSSGPLSPGSFELSVCVCVFIAVIQSSQIPHFFFFLNGFDLFLKILILSICPLVNCFDIYIFFT